MGAHPRPEGGRGERIMEPPSCAHAGGHRVLACLPVLRNVPASACGGRVRDLPPRSFGCQGC